MCCFLIYWFGTTYSLNILLNMLGFCINYCIDYFDGEYILFCVGSEVELFVFRWHAGWSGKKWRIWDYLKISPRVWSGHSIILFVIYILHTFRCSHWYSGMRQPIGRGILPAHWRRWPIGYRWSCTKQYLFHEFSLCDQLKAIEIQQMDK